MSVIYIDPDESNRNLAIQKIDSEVKTVSNLEEAKEIYNGETIVSEYLFSGYDTGLDFIEEIESDSVLYTSYSKDFVSRDSRKRLNDIDFIRKGPGSWKKINRWLNGSTLAIF